MSKSVMKENKMATMPVNKLMINMGDSYDYIHDVAGSL